MRRLRVAGGSAGIGSVALAVALLAAAPSWAAGPLQDILACRRIADSASRLACFDRQSAALENLTRATAAASPKPRPPTSRAALDPRKTFGISPEKLLEQEQAAERLPRPLDHITARIQLISKAADGRDIFTLDNHEVWAQLVPDDLYVKPGDAVKISRAMLGSYWLALQSRRGGCKVTRLH